MSRQPTHQHLLRDMDALTNQAAAVEGQLARQIRPPVYQDFAVVFYDLTTVRILGEGDVDELLPVSRPAVAAPATAAPTAALPGSWPRLN